ncbi:MAG: dihydroorotate dehydrogenase electron transfer subunit [Candidatus Omnitrophota bacterium]|nr:dihydroorotate dehydrogenase electron transfer subunit [Candidatus Omnitrophota bacterium]
MKILQCKAKIVSSRRIQGDYYKIVLASPEIAAGALPGQFISVKIDGDYQPLLRRPFSIHRANKRELEILYAVVGEGTRLLSQKKPGKHLDVIGPLGNGFDYERPLDVARGRRSTPRRCSGQANDGRLILVAGGMGVAPLLFLAEQLVCRPSSVVRKNILVLLGAKNKKEVLCVKEFKKLGCEVKISTDNGSMGFKGKVTDLLKILLTTNDPSTWFDFAHHGSLGAGERPLDVTRGRRTTIYACGPRPMLRAISHISLKYNIPAQISLEEHMSCAIGACMGCVVGTLQGFKRVCKEGPVFAADEIIFW